MSRPAASRIAGRHHRCPRTRDTPATRRDGHCPGQRPWVPPRMRAHDALPAARHVGHGVPTPRIASCPVTSRVAHHATAQPIAESSSTVRALSRCSRPSTRQRAHIARVVFGCPAGGTEGPPSGGLTQRSAGIVVGRWAITAHVGQVRCAPPGGRSCWRRSPGGKRRPHRVVSTPHGRSPAGTSRCAWQSIGEYAQRTEPLTGSHHPAGAPLPPAEPATARRPARARAAPAPRPQPTPTGMHPAARSCAAAR